MDQVGIHHSGVRLESEHLSENRLHTAHHFTNGPRLSSTHTLVAKKNVNCSENITHIEANATEIQTYTVHTNVTSYKI